MASCRGSGDWRGMGGWVGGWGGYQSSGKSRSTKRRRPQRLHGQRDRHTPSSAGVHRRCTEARRGPTLPSRVRSNAIGRTPTDTVPRAHLRHRGASGRLGAMARSLLQPLRARVPLWAMRRSRSRSAGPCKSLFLRSALPRVSRTPPALSCPSASLCCKAAHDACDAQHCACALAFRAHPVRPAAGSARHARPNRMRRRTPPGGNGRPAARARECV